MQVFLSILSLVLLVITLKVFSKKRILLTPISIFTELMLIMLFFSLIFENGKFGYNGYIWLLFALLVVNIGQFIGLKVNNAPRKSNTFYINVKRLRNITLIVGLALSLLGVYNYFTAGGISNTAQTALDYYTSGEQQMSFFDNVINQVIGISSMLVSFMGGLYFVIEKKKKWKLICFLGFIYPVLSMLTTSLKLALILAVIYFLVGIFIGYIYVKKEFTVKTIFQIIGKYWILIVALFGLLIFSFMLRFGSFEYAYLVVAFDKMKTYAFGGLQCFNAWFSEYTQDGYRLGAETFMAIPHTLGLVERVGGLYTETYMVGVGETNIYTAFRPLILDFGKYGSMVFLFAIGFLSSKAFRKFSNHRTLFSFFILAVTYVYFVYSFITSPYIYLNITVSFIFFVIIYKLFHGFSAQKATQPKQLQTSTVGGSH